MPRRTAPALCLLLLTLFPVCPCFARHPAPGYPGTRFRRVYYRNRLVGPGAFIGGVSHLIEPTSLEGMAWKSRKVPPPGAPFIYHHPIPGVSVIVSRQQDEAVYQPLTWDADDLPLPPDR